MITGKNVSIEGKLANPALRIDVGHILAARQMIYDYEAKRKEFASKAVSGSKYTRGAFASHRNQAQKNRERWEKELAFQLAWLRRHRPDIYKEVTE